MKTTSTTASAAIILLFIAALASQSLLFCNALVPINIAAPRAASSASSLQRTSASGAFISARSSVGWTKSPSTPTHHRHHQLHRQHNNVGPLFSSPPADAAGGGQQQQQHQTNGASTLPQLMNALWSLISFASKNMTRGVSKKLYLVILWLCCWSVCV